MDFFLNYRHIKARQNKSMWVISAKSMSSLTKPHKLYPA